MKKLKSLILLSLVVAGCTGGHDKGDPETADRLGKTESLVFTDIDSALVVFESIGREKLSGNENLARYNLLNTIIDDRLGKTHLSSDDIGFAENYFADSSAPDSLLAIVHIYAGRVYEDMGQTERALESYLMAQSHADDTENNHYWKGRIAYHIASLYHKDFDYSHSSVFLNQAIRYFESCNDVINMAHSLNLLGRNHLLSGDYRQALEALRKASEIYLLNDHTAGLLSNALSISDIYLNDMDEVFKADSVLSHARSNFSDGTIPLSYFPIMSQIEATKGNYPYAVGLLKEYMDINPGLSPKEKAAYKYYLATYLHDSGQYSSAYDYLHQYSSIVDSLSKVEITTVLQEIEKRYEKQELENEYNTYRKVTRYKIAIVLICLFVFISFLIFTVNKRREKIVQLQADLDGMTSRMNEFDDLKNNLSTVLDRHTEKETRLHEVLINKMLHIQKLVDYLFLYENNPDEFQKKVSTAVIQAEKDRYFGELHEIEKYAGVVDYLKEHYPTLSEDELNICCLICFGFNNNQIGILFGYTNPNSIFNKRHKLRKKMGLWPNYESLEAYLSQLVADLREGTIPEPLGN